MEEIYAVKFIFQLSPMFTAPSTSQVPGMNIYSVIHAKPLPSEENLRKCNCSSLTHNIHVAWTTAESLSSISLLKGGY